MKSHAGNAKTEVCGLAPEIYPRPQFQRSSFGGYFGPMLKFAGYDGVVIVGKANTPVTEPDLVLRRAGHHYPLP